MKIPTPAVARKDFNGPLTKWDIRYPSSIAATPYKASTGSRIQTGPFHSGASCQLTIPVTPIEMTKTNMKSNKP